MGVTRTGMHARWSSLQARNDELERDAAAMLAAIEAVYATPSPVAQLPAEPRINLYDELGDWGITASDFAAALGQVPAGNLTVGISSPGGDIFAGVTMYSLLRQRTGTVTVVVDGLAASAASVVAMAASPGRLFMAPNSTLMIHEAWGHTVGPESDHRDTADLLGRESGNIAGIYAARTGQPAAAMRAMMKAETWFIGREAVDAGLADAMLPGSTGQAPDELDAFLAGTAASGTGRPGNSALRQHAYARYAARAGHPMDKVSPFIAAVYRR